MKAQKVNAITVIWIAVVLAAAAGLGYGIRQIRYTLAIRKNLAELKRLAQPVEKEPEVETARHPEPEPAPQVKMAESQTPVVKEPVWEEPEQAPQPEPEVAETPQRQPWRLGQNFGAVQQFFADLNLNEAEQARLREGFALMRRRFESMSEQDRQAETARMAEIGQQWSNMTDQQRAEVTQRMRQRYEQWRNSDSLEIPQLTLE